MMLNESLAELTTSATDALLAIECVAVIIWLRRSAAINPWKTGLWCWVFGLVALSSVLGTVAHGLLLTENTRAVIWQPLYLCLGILVGLFMVGAVYDLRGRTMAKRLIPWSIGAGTVFWGVTEVFSGAFVIFVIFEAIAMLGALAIYLFLTVTRRLRGAGAMTMGVLLNLLAAGVQESDVSVHILFPLDHNGIFHLIQMVGILVLGFGLRLGMQREVLYEER